MPPIITVSLPSLNSGFFSAAPFWILIDLPISEATVDNGIYRTICLTTLIKEFRCYVKNGGK